MVAGPVIFEVQEPTEFVLHVQFAADQRSIPLRVTTPPFTPNVIHQQAPPE
jgi:hypothetical protein